MKQNTLKIYINLFNKTTYFLESKEIEERSLTSFSRRKPFLGKNNYTNFTKKFQYKIPFIPNLMIMFFFAIF